MRILRMALGVLVGAYGVFCLFPIAANVLYKTGQMPNPKGDAARMVPLWQATSWWELAVWTAIVVLFFIIAFRLLHGRPTFSLYLAAIVADGALWWVMHASEAYQQAFSPAELQTDYLMLAGMALVGVLIWLAERRPAPHPASA
jgi:hypothetical protein